MEIKCIVLSLCIGFFTTCGILDTCKRLEKGEIILPNGDYSLKKVIMIRDEGNGFEYTYSLSVTKDGSYSQQLVEPHSSCKNNCNETTVAPKTRITITDSSQTQIFLDTMFYCSKDYTYSGNDIVLPTLTIP